MVKYLILEAYSDSDGNGDADVVGVYDSLEEAKVGIKERHDKIVCYYDNPSDTYDEGDDGFNIYDEDDSVNWHDVHIKSIEF